MEKKENKKLYIISLIIGISTVFLFVIFFVTYFRSMQESINISTKIDALEQENQDIRNELMIYKLRENRNK